MNKDRLFASLEQKISKGVGHRVDLQLADARRINKSTAHFMIAFNEGSPASDEVADFFIRKFNAKVTPHLSTARVYKEQKVVTVVASILNITRDFEDIKKMTPVIEGATYLDVPLQETWEVSERAGKKVLVRKVKDDIMAIVQARKSSMLDSSSRKTFAALAEGSQLLKYLMMLDKGDHVKVYMDDKVVDAEIVAASEGEVKVKFKGGTATLPRQAVLEVTSRSEEREKHMKDEARKYFSDAYGDPEYAKELTK